MPRPSRKRRHVLLHLTPMAGFGEPVREGIAACISTNPRWSFAPFDMRLIHEVDTGVAAVLAGNVDGILGAFASNQAKQIAQLNIPAVTMFHQPDPSPIAAVHCDDQVIGRTAVEHLLACGFSRIAVMGATGLYARSRERGAVEAAHDADADYHVLPVDDILREHGWVGREQAALDWFAALPRPIGVYVADDATGALVIDWCNEHGIPVPDEVAVITSNNNTLNCLFADPPMSSVQPDWYRVGYEAAALLDRMMEGEPRPDAPITIPPIDIIVRRSSDVLAVDDRDVAAALRFIREHADESINVWDVLDAVPVARRSLERKFRQQVGHSPWQEIRRVRIEHTKKLLAQTDLPMPDLAARTAFRDAKDLATQFKKMTGMTPTQYRRQYRHR